MTSPYDTDFRLEKRVTLSVAALYLESYSGTDDMGNFDKAEEFLDKYNIGLKIWPGVSRKQRINTMHNAKYRNSIPHKKEAYVELRKDVDAFLKNRVPDAPFFIPIIFCQFDADGVGVTPHSTKIGFAAPACLIRTGASSVKDRMTVVHEMGHSALYPKHVHNKNKGNLMHEAEMRTYMYRYQAEAFATSMFARTG